jgi:PAS domain S-box-containing protein
MDTPLRVLLVENSEDDALLIVGELTRGGYRPLPTRVDTPAAMRAALARQAYDIIIADYVMPQFSGLEALKIVQEAKLDLPLIVVSGKISEEVAVEAMRAGAHDYILKNNLARLIPVITRELREVAARRERFRAERELRLSEERFAKTFNASPALMAIVSADGYFININNSFLDATGYNYEDVIGHTPWELNFWSDSESRTRFSQIMLELNSVRNLEISFSSKPGKVRVGLLSTEPTELNGEQCLILTINDITEFKQIEVELARLDRLNLVGEIAAGIGHEIRNPMTIVRGFLQVLSGKEECLHYKEYYTLMIEELDRANSIIAEFLALARNKTVNLKLHNLNTTINTLNPLIIADAMMQGKFIQLELGEVPDILLDEKEIRQLVLNLVRNGLEAMGPGGKLTIKTSTGGSSLILSVQDEGRGIPGEFLDKLGTPFFTTKDNGTGLGLATCYRVASRHNAAIRVDTGVRGTTFYVEFKAPCFPAPLS